MSPWLHRIDPIALQFPEFSLFGMTLHPAVHWYGVMYLLGFGLAWWLGRRRVLQGRLPGVDAQAFGDLVFYGMLGVILRSEEHTSELQSRENLVCRLLLEKKKEDNNVISDDHFKLLV